MGFISEDHDGNWRKGRQVMILFLEIDAVLFFRQFPYLPILWNHEHILIKINPSTRKFNLTSPWVRAPSERQENMNLWNRTMRDLNIWLNLFCPNYKCYSYVLIQRDKYASLGNLSFVTSMLSPLQSCPHLQYCFIRVKESSENNLSHVFSLKSNFLLPKWEENGVRCVFFFLIPEKCF